MKKHDHHQGLAQDLKTLQQSMLQRRAVLRWAVGAGLVTLVGCDEALTVASADAAGSGTGSAAGSGGSGAAAESGSCSVIPEETAGPYPADGSNGANGGGPGGGPGGPGAPGQTTTASSSDAGSVINALALSGIVRSDIRPSFAGATGVAEGVPLTITLSVVDVADGCSPLAGFAVYLWHCDRGGNYSLYSSSAASENYLRGVQETDDQGTVTFQSIFPACYSGRWPHAHFEIYPSLDSVTTYTNKLATSQLALPEDVCNLVFAQPGYEQSVTNLSRVTLSSDGIFSDGYSTQLPTLTGSIEAGYTAKLTIGVNVS